MFLTELCDVIGVAHPDPAGADNVLNRYVFDRSITRTKHDGSVATVYADLYKRGRFTPRDEAGRQRQARPRHVARAARPRRRRSRPCQSRPRRARHPPVGLRHRARPPFLIVCDVGYVIEPYSEFTCTSGTYLRFPDPKSHRIHLAYPRRP